MKKIPIYLVPGLAAGPEIFENLNLSESKYSIHYLEWKRPLALEESITNYAMRMCEDVKEENPVLVGVSFGGIMVQEMSKFIHTKKVILVSSVKTNHELPKRFKLAKFTKAYKLFPTKIVSNFEDYARFFITNSHKRKVKTYKKYLSVRNQTYINWAISAVINWHQDKSTENLIQIHGTDDQIFPLKNINKSIEIEGGSHVMIITKAKKISKIIDEALAC
jgi:hypothetical protein